MPKKGKSGGKKPGLGGARDLHVRVKTAKGRKPSSTRWLQRQLNDPYVAAARREGYLSRAAYKLLDLDDKFKILKSGDRVIDLGAAPGGWTQVVVERVGDQGKVVAADTSVMEDIQGAQCFQLDVFAPDAIDRLREALGGAANVVLSDMAAPSTGHSQTDHIRIIGLCEAALDVATEMLAPGGAFVAKVLQGGTEQSLLLNLKRLFTTVRHAKPDASRKDSAELYVVALGFRGPEASEP